MQTQPIRSTIDFKPELMRVLKQIALMEGTTFREVVHKAAEEFVERREAGQGRRAMGALEEIQRLAKKNNKGVNLTKLLTEERKRKINDDMGN